MMNVVDTTFSAKNNNKELFYVAEPEMLLFARTQPQRSAVIKQKGSNDVRHELWTSVVPLFSNAGKKLKCK